MAKLDVSACFEVYDLNEPSEEHWVIVSVSDADGNGVSGLTKGNFKVGAMWKVGLMGLTVGSVTTGSMAGVYALKLIVTGSTTSAFGVEQTFVAVAVKHKLGCGQTLAFNPYACCGGHGGTLASQGVLKAPRRAAKRTAAARSQK